MRTVFIGNDVVDLGLPVTQDKASHTRFLDRVCTADERAALDRSHDPNLSLWCLWSAKETAYKIALRRRPETIFFKKNFVVHRLPLFEWPALAAAGEVGHDGEVIPVRWKLDRDYAHCAGVWPGGRVSLDAVAVAVARVDDPDLANIPLSVAERASVRLPQSQRARQLAKRLLARQGVRDVEVIRPQVDGPSVQRRHKAPRLWRGGREWVPSALSLSHHGRFVAAAVWVGEVD